VRQDTATRILDVAERLFVEHGFEATSLRMITQQAEVNLAAVNTTSVLKMPCYNRQ